MLLPIMLATFFVMKGAKKERESATSLLRTSS
jgi:hypothetical protein